MKYYVRIAQEPGFRIRQVLIKARILGTAPSPSDSASSKENQGKQLEVYGENLSSQPEENKNIQNYSVIITPV